MFVYGIYWTTEYFSYECLKRGKILLLHVFKNNQNDQWIMAIFNPIVYTVVSVVFLHVLSA